MDRRAIIGGMILGLAMGLGEPKVRAQGIVSLADDIIIISSGENAKQKERDATHLGPIHGSVEHPFGTRPGADEPRLGERLPERRPLDLLQAASRRVPSRPRAEQRPFASVPPPLPEEAPAPVPLYGPVQAIPEDEGPPDGLTLEQAIARLVAVNPDLAVKFREIPKADADILTAGLWSNPLIFASFSDIPYGSYTPNRPGSTGYGITLVQPFDLNGKIRARTKLARANKQVLGAQYQDAVRLEIRNLHGVWVDVLAARTTVRYLQTSSENFEVLIRTTRDRVSRGASAEQDLDTVLIGRDQVTNAREEAEVRFRQAKRRLAVMLAVPASQSDLIELKGTLHDLAPVAPPTEELVRIALCNRPDLAAYRLGVRSAVANVEVERRERFPDVFALYSPYEFTANNDVYASRSATAWGAGIFATIPINNRNQGNIRRAHENVIQSQTEVSALENRIVAEVENASLEYVSSRSAVERIERSTSPRARHRLEDVRRLYVEGQENLDAYLNAQRDFNEVVRQYRDALLRHRRSMLALNTVVGLRLLP
jgi:cobalt-zinc-cadmium efflux system outer membrane protein